MCLNIEIWLKKYAINGFVDCYRLHGSGAMARDGDDFAEVEDTLPPLFGASPFREVSQAEVFSASSVPPLPKSAPMSFAPERPERSESATVGLTSEAVRTEAELIPDPQVTQPRQHPQSNQMLSVLMMIQQQLAAMQMNQAHLERQVTQ